MENCSKLNMGMFTLKAVSKIFQEQPEDITTVALSETTYLFHAKVKMPVSNNWENAIIEILGNPSESLKKNVESYKEFELRLLPQSNNKFQVVPDNM
ncbi:MAG: hypothetical protein K2N31_01595 [Treponemataceae bacterium]|nr:hypothetical protein [Treponemataceae bacterium]